jgi:hypothetical protein
MVVSNSLKSASQEAQTGELNSDPASVTSAAPFVMGCFGIMVQVMKKPAKSSLSGFL